MNINYKQPQFELFPPNSATIEDVNKPKFLLANLTLSMESLVILAILAIMIGLFSFSIGVERGKHLTAQAMDERVAAAWNLGARRSVAPMVKDLPVKAMAVKEATVVKEPVAPQVIRKAPVNTAVAVKSKPIKKALPAVAAGPALVVTKNVEKRFTVQLATYENLAFAQKEAVNLRRQGWPTFLIRKGKFYLICAGQFNKQEAAQQFQKKASSKYSKSQIRRF